MNKENNEKFWKYYERFHSRKMKISDVIKMVNLDNKKLAGAAHSYNKWKNIVDKKIPIYYYDKLCGMCYSTGSIFCAGCPLYDCDYVCSVRNEKSYWKKINDVVLNKTNPGRNFTKSEQRSLEILSRKMLNTIKKCCSKYYGISFKNR